MYFVNEEKSDELYQLGMIFPFSSDAVPFLGCGDYYVRSLDITHMTNVGITRQFGTFET
jgi:3-polyprenyl-4-hydroxybenzoate decarboxylase